MLREKTEAAEVVYLALDVVGSVAVKCASESASNSIEDDCATPSSLGGGLVSSVSLVEGTISVDK